MIIFSVGVFLLVKTLRYIFGVAIASTGALLTIAAILIFAGILLFFVHGVRQWGIPVILGAILFMVFMEHLAAIASTLAVVLSVLIVGTLTVLLKVRIFRYLRSDAGRVLPTWAQWLLRLI